MHKRTPEYRRLLIRAVEDDGRLARLAGIPLHRINNGVPCLVHDLGLPYTIIRQAVARGWRDPKGRR
jgi:hypothetical protein